MALFIVAMFVISILPAALADHDHTVEESVIKTDSVELIEVTDENTETEEVKDLEEITDENTKTEDV